MKWTPHFLAVERKMTAEFVIQMRDILSLPVVPLRIGVKVLVRRHFIVDGRNKTKCLCDAMNRSDL